MVRPPPVSFFLFYLTLIALQVTKISAIGKKTCEKCVGKEYCVVKKAPDCIEGNIDCSDPCLDLDIRSSECFETSIPDGETCDKSCDFCVKQYRCNIAMNDLGIFSDDTFDCIEWENCLDGQAKTLCAGGRNNGNCHDYCNTCVGSDNCAVSNSNQCSNEKIDCFAKCLNNDVQQAICFNSSIPDGNNCDEECNFCLDQFVEGRLSIVSRMGIASRRGCLTVVVWNEVLGNAVIVVAHASQKLIAKSRIRETGCMGFAMVNSSIATASALQRNYEILNVRPLVFVLCPRVPPPGKRHNALSLRSLLFALLLPFVFVSPAVLPPPRKFTFVPKNEIEFLQDWQGQEFVHLIC